MKYEYKHTLPLLLLTMVASLLSCSKEDAIEVKVDDTRYYFEPQPERTDEEAVLRRNFYDTYGIHLLFNDTLRHDSIGVDFNGDTHYFTECVDMYYSVGGSTVGSNQNRYKLLTSMEQKRLVTKYLEEEIQPHFSDRMRPFSWLLVDEIAERPDSYSAWTYPYAITGERCIAIAFSTYFKLPESRIPAYTQQVLNLITVKIALNNMKALDDFFNISAANYSKTFASSGISNAENTLMLREAGFFSRGKNSDNFASNGVYPSRETDLADFVRLATTYTPQKMKELYSDYPTIIRKDSVLRLSLEARGYIFNP